MPINADETVSVFVSSHKRLNARSKTAYETDVRQFLEFLISQGVSLEQCSVEDFERYVAAKEYSKSSVLRSCASIAGEFGFFRFLQNTEGFNPPFSSKTISSRAYGRKTEVESHTFGEEEFGRLIGKILERNSQSYFNERDALAAILAFRTGNSINEIVAANMPDLAADGREFRFYGGVFETKGREKDIVLGYGSARERFVDSQGFSDNDALLLNDSGNRISARSSRRNIGKFSEQKARPVNFKALKRSYDKRNETSYQI